MKLIKLFSFLFAGMLLFSSCIEDKKDDSGFVNKLTFGTSINYTNFTLGDEGSSFSTSPGNVAYRLESDEDFNSNPVKFVIKKDGATYSTEIFSSNPTPTGHIFMTVSYTHLGLAPLHHIRRMIS